LAKDSTICRDVQAAEGCSVILKYERHCERQVENRLNTEYVDDRLQSALREQLKIIRRELPDWYQRVTDANRMEMAMARLRSQIREQLNFPTFEQDPDSDFHRSGADLIRNNGCSNFHPTTLSNAGAEPGRCRALRAGRG
jgi:hypothetical protein